MADLAALSPPAGRRPRRGSWRQPGRNRPRGLVTALDVEGQTLRVVQTRQRGRQVRISRVAVEELDLPKDANPNDPHVLGRALARALDRLRIKASPVVMGVPRALVVLRALSVPAVDDVRELASLVHFQIAKDLPFRLEDAVVDFKVRQPLDAGDGAAEPGANDDGTGKDVAANQPKLDVLVAVVKREIVEFYEQTAAAAGIKLMALGFRPYANARCVEACHVVQGSESVAFVSLRPDEVLVDVIAQQDLVFSRGTSAKLQADAAEDFVTDSQLPELDSALGQETDLNNEGSPQSLLDAITIEVVRSFHSFGGMEVKNPVARLVVAGATGHEQTVVEALRQRLSIPCGLLEPARSLDLPLEARGYASGAIAALGLGLGVFDRQGLPFDFLNPKRPAVRRNTKRLKVLTLTAAVAAVVLILGAIEFYLLRQKARVRQTLEAELAVEDGRKDLYRRMRVQAATLKGWAAGRQNWLAHYAYLSSVLPPCDEVYLSAFSVSSQGTLSLAVQARSGETLASLEKQLTAAGYEVQPLAIKPGKDRYGYPFRSSVELVVPAKLQIDLSKLNPPARPADDGSLDAAKGGGS